MGLYCRAVHPVPASWRCAVSRMAILMSGSNLTKAQEQALLDHLEDYISLMNYFTVPESDSVKQRAKALLSECRKEMSNV